MVATREDTTQAKNDDQEKGSTQRETKGRSRCIHMGWCKMILALHCVLFLFSFSLAPLTLMCLRNTKKEMKGKNHFWNVNLEGIVCVCVGGDGEVFI